MAQLHQSHQTVAESRSGRNPVTPGYNPTTKSGQGTALGLCATGVENELIDWDFMARWSLRRAEANSLRCLGDYLGLPPSDFRPVRM